MHKPIGEYDQEGQRLIFAVADIKARLILIRMAEIEYEAGNKAGACSFMHAEAYLQDRIVYELAPWPKHHFLNPEWIEAAQAELPVASINQPTPTAGLSNLSTVEETSASQKES